MGTLVILSLIAYFWWKANKAYESSGLWKYRRLRSSWLWAFAGASVGSFFGVAGLGTAIAGTIPGAVIGFLAASNLMRRDFDETDGDVLNSPAFGASQASDSPSATTGDPAVISCPACSQRLRVPQGKTLVVKCVKCGKPFVYP